ncbi:MAG TPA: NAD-dependent epimerase/dehydratase family protein [Dongiaceae bacterium]|nr:NAD-dependent epimerase/dehydratase family protein [Dongiaceae bacterium]
MDLTAKIRKLAGPILVLGASGFVGANILRKILSVREDVVGSEFSKGAWRLDAVPEKNRVTLNLQDPASIRSALDKTAPATIFDCTSFGAYSFEQDFQRIHETNYLGLIRLMEEIEARGLVAYIHAGSSSEYGLNAAGPSEDDTLLPNSHYAVSKAAASLVVGYYGKVRGLPVVNLRLYSVYGPYEDSSRLIPAVCTQSLESRLPIFAHPDVMRDFVYIDDVVEAFIGAALAMGPEIAGESFNIGTGVQTSLASLAETAQRIFEIKDEPQFDETVGRNWDLDKWFANPSKAAQRINWTPQVGLEEGLRQTRNWWRDMLASAHYSQLTKKNSTKKVKNSVSAIVACYKDEQAIPIMYERLVRVFNRLDLDYEIIFVNDNSPDNSAEIIRQISARDPSVIGICHSRNFGSQSAFRSGMEMATKESCVLLDGDLQDPPELIEKFVETWQSGVDVVYGRRVGREMPFWLETCYRGFYRLFSAMSEVPVPRDAGDFSLLDRRVVHWMLECKERDAFLRGLRAYVGFNQVGIDYIRPERMFGVSTNNWIKNIGWAKKGIFSFSRMPLHVMTAFGGIAVFATILLAFSSVLIRMLAPDAVPKGVTFISLLVMFFGSATILGIGLLGEYIGKIFEETKARPVFIRRDLITRGEIRPAEIRERT